MSVIVKDKQNDTYLLLTKGADSVIEKLLKKSKNNDLDKTKKLIDEWAEVGLRTLMLAKREFDAEFFNKWDAKYRAIEDSNDT
jgi:magnesium-transporting ATPase (P-type)